MTTHPLQENPTGRQRCLEIALWTLAAFAIRLYHLDYRGMWTDEFHTLQPILLPVRDLVRERLAAGHLPTYFLMMKGWIALVGVSDWTLRFPSAVFGAVLIPAAAALGRQFLAWRDVRLLMLLACVNATAVWSSQEARMYSMLVFAATMAHACYLQALGQGTVRAWLSYVMWLAVAISLQPVMLLFLAAHLFFSVSVRKVYPAHARAAARLAVGILAAGIPAVAFYLASQSEVTGLRLRVPSVAALAKSVQLIAFGRPAWYAIMKYVVPLVFLGCLLGLIRGRDALRNADEAGLPGAKFCIALVAVPVLLLYGFAVFVERSVSIVGVERYLIPCAVPLWILVLWGVRHARPGTRSVLGVAVGMCLVFGLAGRWADRGTGMREAARYLAAHAVSGDVVLMRDSDTMALALAYYGATQVRPCLVAQDDLSTSEILTAASICVAGRDGTWLFNYRDDRQKLQRVLESRQDAFRQRSRYEFDRAGIVRYDVDAARLAASR